MFNIFFVRIVDPANCQTVSWNPGHMEARRWTPEESELLSVTLTKKIINFDQSPSLIFQFFSFCTLLTLSCEQRCSGCKISLSPSLCVSVCYTCVSIAGFKSILCFIFLLSSTVGKQCALHMVGRLPSICSPPCFPTGPDSHLGIWGSRDVDSKPSSMSCLYSAGKPPMAPFLIQNKTQGLPTGLQVLMQVGPLP